MTDQNRKTLRSFYCRDYLWELFEQMTHELGCSMDYLINESMRLYARNRDAAGPDAGNRAAMGNMNGPGGAPNLSGRPQPPQPVDRFNVGYQSAGMEHRTFERMPSVNQNARPPATGGFGAVPPPAPTNGLAGGPPPPPPRPQSGGWSGPSTGGFGSMGTHQPAQPSFGGPAPVARRKLFLTFNNNHYPVDKDKFVIGRGSQQTDLTIRDGNISRKHCAVIFYDGKYYIKDLGSTNGIEFQGARVESKEIFEGDVFYLCDYELQFSYR